MLSQQLGAPRALRAANIDLPAPDILISGNLEREIQRIRQFNRTAGATRYPLLCRRPVVRLPSDRHALEPELASFVNDLDDVKHGVIVMNWNDKFTQ